MPAEPTRRFRIGDVPPLADGFTDRPDTVTGLAEVLVPGAAVALIPDPAVAQTLPNWPAASGKTQIAVMAAESLWRSGGIDGLIWISATSRAAVISGLVQASVAVTSLEPTGTASSVAVRFVSWLGETRLPWLVVLDDVPESVDLTGLWPAGPAGRLLITGPRPVPALGRLGIRVIPVGFFSTREALHGLSERLSGNPDQRQGAIDLVETLGCEPLALGQASTVVAGSNLTCRDYRDLFIQRRDEIWTGSGGIPSAAMVTWILCLERAESSLPSPLVRLMLVFLALLDGHGVPGSVFGTQALLAYLSGAADPFSAPADPRHAWNVLRVLQRAGLITINRYVTPPAVLMSSALQEAVKLAAPADFSEPAARAAASALLEAWPAEEPSPWAAASLRANAASLQDSAMDALWADGCHPLLRRVGRSLDESGLAGPAVEFWQDLAARCDAKLAPGHPAIVAARVGLARALIMASEPADAVTVMLRAVSDYEQSRGAEHPQTLSARDELAAAYQAAGDIAAAGRLLARSLADRERLHGPSDALAMATRERLAAAYLADGRPKDAIAHYKRVLADREKVLGRGHPDTIATAGSLSAAYRAAGRMPAAMQYGERCRTDSERVLGRDHADTLARMLNLAHLYYAVGRVGDAVALLHETSARCERILLPDDPLTRAVRQSLANIGDG
jgi:tetratricopeptide (TPR) repeat protein